MGKKSKKHLRIVSFDEEVIKKDSADAFKINSDVNLNEINEDENSDKLKNRKKKRKSLLTLADQAGDTEYPQSQEQVKSKRKKKKSKGDEKPTKGEETNRQSFTIATPEPHRDKLKLKRNKNELIENKQIASQDNDLHVNGELSEKKVKRKKKNKLEATESAEQTPESETTDGISTETSEEAKAESIRAQKRKKHQKLLEEKRLKSELSSQQNVLNYLSKWKHCRNEWKFEKLKQIWLQQNLFDTGKVPSEFWETAVEYFSGAKGAIRSVILKEALKIIEKEESTEEENTNENELLVLQRARDIVQHLQE
ncbi:hypothetical protein NQ315_007763 [Exocentrus adspersus]|uniref:WKF domain-containing protein n=1 Tax=Exocentrus adspersus TaxID=1586481 RepID=A0AAV8W8W1_9CUCU|nr:hypothetical protein NQ315_007763 [Exocentrus adspersus]